MKYTRNRDENIRRSEGKRKDYYYIHIAEDDALLSKTFVELIEKIGEEPDWDILQLTCT